MMDVVADKLIEAGAEEIICQAIGFLVDHVEVAYDLDTELREQCENRRSLQSRPCVHDHPRFIGALTDSIETRLREASLA